MAQGSRPKIVILGAGFAGLYAARELARLLPAEDRPGITLVDRNNFFLFTPMLTEVAGGEIDTRHCVAAVRRLAPGINFEQARVDAIDLANKRVTLAVGDAEQGIPETQKTLEFDHLVIALGSVTNFHHIDGLQEHSITVKTIGDATAIYDRALALLERADDEREADRRRALLTFVVGGGGFSGVETMAALNDLVRANARHFPGIAPSDIRTVLVHPEDRLLPELNAALAAFAQRELQRRGVEVMLNTKITGAGSDYAEIQGGHRIDTHTLIWTGGVMPNPVIADLDIKRGHHGGIVVDACLAVEGHPNIWALGDCAEVPRGSSGKTYAPTAQNATREGTLVARNIVAVLNGRKPRPFRYTPIGELALVGRRAGVADLRGYRFSGFIAWLMWRAVYLAKMPSMAKRLRVATDWLIDFVAGRELAAVPTVRAGQDGKPAAQEHKQQPARG